MHTGLLANHLTAVKVTPARNEPFYTDHLHTISTCKKNRLYSKVWERKYTLQRQTGSLIWTTLPYFNPSSSTTVWFKIGPVRQRELSKACNGSKPNPQIYCFDGTQAAKWSVCMSFNNRWEIWWPQFYLPLVWFTLDKLWYPWYQLLHHLMW